MWRGAGGPDGSVRAGSRGGGSPATVETICSDPETTELSFDGFTWIDAYATHPLGPYGATIPEAAGSGRSSIPLSPTSRPIVSR